MTKRKRHPRILSRVRQAPRRVLESQLKMVLVSQREGNVAEEIVGNQTRKKANLTKTRSKVIVRNGSPTTHLKGRQRSNVNSHLLPMVIPLIGLSLIWYFQVGNQKPPRSNYPLMPKTKLDNVDPTAYII
jgi:hypothetical protein